MKKHGRIKAVLIITCIVLVLAGIFIVPANRVLPCEPEELALSVRTSYGALESGDIEDIVLSEEQKDAFLRQLCEAVFCRDILPMRAGIPYSKSLTFWFNEGEEQAATLYLYADGSVRLWKDGTYSYFVMLRPWGSALHRSILEAVGRGWTGPT